MMRSSRYACLLAALVAAGTSASVRAHEIGTTRVTLTVSDATYQLEIVTDAAALAAKLIAADGRSVETPSNAADLETLIRAANVTFQRRVALRIDDVVSAPSISYAVAAPVDALSAPAATIRMTGAIPSGARVLGWNYGWTFATYAFTVRAADGASPATTWLDGGSSTTVPLHAAAPTMTRRDVAFRYLALGFTHIVPNGLDHMLFVLGIFLLTRRPRAILWQVSAFTIAHSIALGLSIYGLVSVTPRIVEPLIAVSIAYVAIENVVLSDLKPWRVALVFAFGLLHGLGFAGALRDVGLPRSEFATALLTFNVGVEAGQLAVIAAATAIFGWYFQRDWYRRRVVVPASGVIACVAIYWMVDRIWN